MELTILLRRERICADFSITIPRSWRWLVTFLLGAPAGRGGGGDGEGVCGPCGDLGVGGGVARHERCFGRFPKVLKALRLPTQAEESGGQSHLDCLEALLEAELAEREGNAVARRIVEAHLDILTSRHFSAEVSHSNRRCNRNPFCKPPLTLAQWLSITNSAEKPNPVDGANIPNFCLDNGAHFTRSLSSLVFHPFP